MLCKEIIESHKYTHPVDEMHRNNILKKVVHLVTTDI